MSPSRTIGPIFKKMTRWAEDPPRKPPPDPPDPNGVTDDPLAALGLDSRSKGGRNKGQVYAVSRVNPLFQLSKIEPSETQSNLSSPNTNLGYPSSPRSPPSGCEKSASSEYTRSPDRHKSKSDSRYIYSDQDDLNDLAYNDHFNHRNGFRRQKTTTSEYSRPSSREKSPEIDYDDPLPRQISGLSDYSEKLVAKGYVNDALCQKSSSFGSSGDSHRVKSRSLREKSGSSGYGGSNRGSSLENIFNDKLRLVDEAGAVLEQNPVFVKSIRIAGRGLKTTKSVPSQHSASSGGGTLSTIPEGRVDLPVPQPIWPGPLDHRSLLNSYNYDSLVDEALLLYTSLSHHNNVPDSRNKHESYLDVSVKDLLLDLLASINQTLEGKTGTPEEMLKIVTEKIKLKLEMLRNCTEEDMKKLCINLSNSSKVNSVLRAFSHGSSSGNSTSSGRARTTSSNDDDIYHIPSGSSSSGFSDSPPGQRRPSTPLLPHFYGRKSSILSQLYCDHNNSTLSRGIRNALIYGTLYRHKMPSSPKTISRLPSDETEPVDPARVCSGTTAQNTATALEKNDISDQKNIEIEISDDRISCARTKLNCLKNFSCDRNNFLVKGGRKNATVPKRGLLGQKGDDKPSVWQLYYGMRAEGSKRYGEGEPTDIPVFAKLYLLTRREEEKFSNRVFEEEDFLQQTFRHVPLKTQSPSPGTRLHGLPYMYIRDVSSALASIHKPGGRPEADFTLDVPRSELLSKRLREDKKWRFRCRLLTSFLGLVFFLLSVMGVSLVLTRGKRMFGSML